MRIARLSLLTGHIQHRTMDVTPAQLKRLGAGEAIEEVLGHLSPAQRAFFVTGIPDEEWQTLPHPRPWLQP